MGVYSSGNSYGVSDDLMYSFPVTIKVWRLGVRPHFHVLYARCSMVFLVCRYRRLRRYSDSVRAVKKLVGHAKFWSDVPLANSPQNKTWKIVNNLAINDFSRGKMDATATELVEERDTAISFLGAWLGMQWQSDTQEPMGSRLWQTSDVTPCVSFIRFY